MDILVLFTSGYREIATILLKAVEQSMKRHIVVFKIET